MIAVKSSKTSGMSPSNAFSAEILRIRCFVTSLARDELFPCRTFNLQSQWPLINNGVFFVHLGFFYTILLIILSIALAMTTVPAISMFESSRRILMVPDHWHNANSQIGDPLEPGMFDMVFISYSVPRYLSSPIQSPLIAFNREVSRGH